VLLLADASKTLLCTLKDTQLNKGRVRIACVTSLQHQMWSKLPRLSHIATSLRPQSALCKQRQHPLVTPFPSLLYYRSENEVVVWTWHE